MPVVGIGVDTIEVARFADALARRPRLAERCFTPDEVAYCGGRVHPAQHYAVRFAAKEAIGKALGVGMRRWQEAEVVRGRFGAPEAQLHGRLARRGEQLGIVRIHLALTHSRTDAVAVAVAETGP